jgi:hypothetical protein
VQYGAAVQAAQGIGATFGQMRALFLLTTLLLAAGLQAQPERPLQESRHGWYLSPHGTIRVLVIFAEIDWDVEPGKDPQPGGADHWPKGQLPRWKDDLFDPHPRPLPTAKVSRYYHDISLGRLAVLGDYMDQLVVIRQSEHPGLTNAHGINRLVVAEANKLGQLRTQHRMSVADFDQWKRGGRPGLPKQQGPDDPHSYDHLMVILRNSTLTHGQGSVDPGSPGPLFGYESDSQSRFGAMNDLPFAILKHEFNHLFLGGNNFHSGGGNAASFQSYFMSLQGGWSMMGAANSSLLTCCAWDRDRLGWMPEGATHRIRARDTAGRETNTDLDPLAGDTGLFVLRDFVTSGDALRIRIPFIPEDRYQQWLWIENHQGYRRNGSPTDRFHWESANTCIDPVEPGLFMMMQVDREDRVGANIFGGHADYLRPIPANGRYDMVLRDDTLRNSCPFGGDSQVFSLDPRLANPLTGNHEQELPVYDREVDGIVKRTEAFMTGARWERGRITAQSVFFGRPEHAFQMTGKRKIGMGTNPSSTNMLTLVSAHGRAMHKGGAPDVRTIYLNGISVEMLDMATNGEITVRVRANDTRIEEDLRWCADSIVLPPLKGYQGHALVVAPRKCLLLDRSRTPTRIEQVVEEGRGSWFAAPTRLVLQPGASAWVEPRATLELRNGSEILLMPGSSLQLAPRARLRMERGTRIVVNGDARVELPARLRARLERAGQLVRQ